MNDNEAIDKALEGVLSNEEWQALTNDPQVLKKLEQQLGMDALLRVALEKAGTPEALTEAIEASVGASPVEDLMFSIEAATTGTRKQRRWFTSLPRWTTAAAAVVKVEPAAGASPVSGPAAAGPQRARGWPSASCSGNIDEYCVILN